MALLLLLLTCFAVLVSFEKAAAQDAGACVQDLALQDSDPNNDNLQCTSDDVTIAQYHVLNGVTSCVAGENVTVELQAEMVGGAQARYDIGLFVALDGGSGLTGLCARNFLTPTAPFQSSAYSLTSGIGPFRNLENNADRCGDVSQKETNLKNIQTITISCTDSNSDGILDVGSCLSWDQQSTNTCVSLLDTIPGSNAKCRCEPVQVGNVIVRRSARLEVIKEIVPDGTAGFFNLNVTGSSAITNANVQSLYANGVTDVGDNGSTGVLTIPVGSSILPGGRYTVTESAGTNTSLADYASSVACVYRATGAPVAGGSASGIGPLSFNVQPDDDIVCTFTNRSNKGSLEIRKVVDVPTSQWTLSASGATPFSATVTGSDTTGRRVVLTGTYTIGEIGAGVTNLADYDTTWDCTANGQPSTSGSGATSSVAVNANQDVVCTFTNTRKTGSLVITKSAVGGDATFGFTGAGGSLPGAFQITTSAGSGSATYSNVPTGSYTVNEDVLPDGWDFSSLQCSDPSGNTTANGTTALIQVEQNETVNCTFTNTRRGSITITKTVDYNGFETDPDVQQQQYTICVEGASVSYPANCQSFSAGQSRTFDNLLPGSYWVYETAPTANEGWMIAVSNANPAVLAGQDTAVVVSNMPIQGEILVIKSVNPRFVREYQWAITKTVDPPQLDLFVGDTGEVSYALDIVRSIRLDRDFAISGTVAISNPSALPVWINQPVDVLSKGGTVALDCGVASWPQRIAAGAALLCTYDEALAGVYTPADTIINTVSVSLTNNTLYQQSVPFSFSQPTTEVDDAVTLSDPVGGLATQTVSGNLSIPYSKNPTCDAFSDWQNGSNTGSYEIVNTATLSGALTNESDSATLTVNCYRLGVSKTVQPSYALTTTWEITKTVDDPSVDIFAGDSQDVTYTVYVTNTGTYSGSWAVAGTIAISNPAPLTANLSSIEDLLAGAYPGVVSNCSPSAAVIAPFGQVTCAYAIDLSGAGAVDGNNVASAVLINNDGGTTSFTGSQAVAFADAQIVPVNDSVDVHDTFAGLLGSFQTTGTTTYTRTLDCAAVTGYSNGMASRAIGNMATIVQTGQSDSENVALTCYIPAVRKDATPSYTLTYTWQLEKVVYPSTVDLFDGASATLNYTVTATRDSGTAGSWSVTGVISVTNPHPTASIDLTGAVADGIDGGIYPSVNCPTHVAPGSTETCTYSALLPDAATRLNTATLTLFGYDYEGTATIDFGSVLPAEVNASLTVNDDYGQADSPWNFTTSRSETYSRLVDCSGFTEQNYTAGSAGTTVTNTASATQESGEQLNASANVDLGCYRPAVSKTAVPSHTITYTWDITKTADDLQVDLFDGNGQTVTYTIEAIKDGGTPGSWRVSGAVTVLNPNPSETIPLAALTDQLNGGYGAVAIDCGNATEIPAASNSIPGSLTCTYAAALPDGTSRTNTATVTLYGMSYSGLADIAFHANEAIKVHDGLTVTDTVAGPWAFHSSGSETYPRLLTCADVFGQVDYGSDGTISTDLLNTALGRGDNGVLLDQDNETVTLTCYQPRVSKDAVTGYTRTYDWTVSKVVTPSRLDLFDGETASVTYTIHIVKLPAMDSAFSVAGVISITNPHPTQQATFAVADMLPGNLAATVDCGNGSTAVTVDPEQTETCQYRATPTGFLSGTNIATATMQTDSGPRSYSGEAAVSFDADTPTTVIDNQVGIDDTNAAFGAPVTATANFFRAYTVEYGCQNIDFSQGTTAYQQEINTVTVDKTVDDTATATVDLYCYLPTVAKTAQGAYGETYDWTLVKTANPERLDLFEGESQIVTYTIDVTKTLAAQDRFEVSGAIAISNPHPYRALLLTSVLDQLNTGQVLPNNCAASVPAGQVLACTYGGLVTGVDATSLVANVATVNTVVGRSYASAPQTVDFSQVQPSTFNDAVTIADTQTDQTWSMSDSGPIRYTLVQGCADVVFDGGSTTYHTTLVNTASVREQANRSSTATVDLNCYRLQVSKDANTSYTRQYFWDITKTVEPATWDIFVGDQVASTYTVTALIVGQEDRDWLVDGTITISNPAPMAAKVTSVVDVLPNGVVASVNCAPSSTLAAHSSMACGYSGQPGGVISGNNVATVTLETSAGNNEYVGTTPVFFGAPTTELSKTVNVTDSRVGELGLFSDGQMKHYATDFSCENVLFGEGATSAGYMYYNTASIDGTGATADAAVSVTCWKPPVVKTANTSYNRVFDYDIVKAADSLEQTIYYTDTATFGYTLQVTKFIKEENGFVVGGTIRIDNPAPIDAELASIEDILPGASNLKISCAPDGTAPYTVPAGGQLICSYSAGLPDKSFRINEARVTMSNGSVVSDTAEVDFDQAAVTPINDSADITDTYFSQVWTVSDSTQTSYNQSFTCEGAAYDEQTGFFHKVMTNVAAVLLPGGDTDSATVTLYCYQLGLVVQKTATPAERPEPGGEFTFDVAVVNSSPVPITLTSINDSVYGDLTQVSGRMTGTTCALPQMPLAANGGQYSCSFTAKVTGQPGFTETDVVTVSGQDAEGNSVSASEDATIRITNTPSAITLTKTASQTELPWPGGDVTFTVQVQNVSPVDTVWINRLTDSIYGDLTQVAGELLATTCSVPQMVAPGATYTCQFVSNLTLPADATEDLVETNVVTATGFDDEENPVEASDDETVTVGVAPIATIGDRVFVDINPDGANSAQIVAGNQQQDYDANGQPVESNVAGIAVLLFAADDTLIAQTQTDASGDYQFTDVPPGDYYVVFVNDDVYLGAWTSYNAQIADEVNSDVDPMLPLDASAQGLVDSLFGSDADAVRTPTFTIQPGQTYLDVDAGLIDLSGAGSVDISGLVWFDFNRDGIRQAEEVQRVSGILVELYKVDESQPNGIAKVDSMTTLADGSYAFTGLDAGVYFIRVTAPNNRISPQDAGSDDDVDSDVDPQTGESQPVLLNGAVVTLDIGVYQIPTALDPGDEPAVGTAMLYLPAVRR